MITDTERLRTSLKQLGLHTLADVFEREAQKAAKAKQSYVGFLAHLVAENLAAKADRSINARIARARFPALRTLEAFDFAFQPSIPAPLIRELAELGFLERAENLLLVGPPGVGKSHMAVALGLRACAARKRVLFRAVPDLLDELVAATVDQTLSARLEVLGRLDLLILDELAYLPMDARRANLFFQLVSRRYEHGSVIVTSNKPFEEWGASYRTKDKQRPNPGERVVPPRLRETAPRASQRPGAPAGSATGSCRRLRGPPGGSLPIREPNGHTLRGWVTFRRESTRAPGGEEKWVPTWGIPPMAVSGKWCTV